MRRRTVVALVVAVLLTALTVGLVYDFTTGACDDTLAACAPQAAFDVTAGDGSLTVEHRGGESFATENRDRLQLELRRDDSVVDTVTWLGPDGVADGHVARNDTLVVPTTGADSAEADARLDAPLEPGDELRVVWTSEGQSAVLAVFVVQPDGSVARPTTEEE